MALPIVTDTLTTTMEIAKRVDSLAREQDDSALTMEAYHALANSLFFLGDFENARQYAIHGIQIWRSGDRQRQVEEVDAPPVTCLTTKALCEWHFGESASCRATMAEAVSLAKELKNIQALALAVYSAAILAHLEGKCYLSASTFVRAGDALHLTAAAENGFAEIYSNDRHLRAAAALFGLEALNVIVIVLELVLVLEFRGCLARREFASS